jgi:hypothetical protein
MLKPKITAARARLASTEVAMRWHDSVDSLIFAGMRNRTRHLTFNWRHFIWARGGEGARV